MQRGLPRVDRNIQRNLTFFDKIHSTQFLTLFDINLRYKFDIFHQNSTKFDIIRHISRLILVTQLDCRILKK